MNRAIEKHSQESIVSSLSMDGRSMIKMPDSPRSVMVYDIVSADVGVNKKVVSAVRKCQNQSPLCCTSTSIDVAIVSPNCRRIFFDTYWKKVGGTKDIYNRYHQVQKGDSYTDTSTSCSLDAEMSKVIGPMTTSCTETVPSLPSLHNDPTKRSSQQRQRRQIFSSSSTSDGVDNADGNCSSNDDEECTMKESLASDLSSLGVDIAPYYRRQVVKKTRTSTTTKNKKGVSSRISCDTNTTGSTPKPSPMIHCVSDSVIAIGIQNQRRLLQQQTNVVLKSSTLQPLQSCLRKSRFSSVGTSCCSGHSRSQSSSVVLSYSSTNTNSNSTTGSTNHDTGSSLLSDESNRSQCSTTSCNSESTSVTSESSTSSSSSSCLSGVTFDNKVTVVQYEIPTDAYCEGGWTNYFAR